MTMNEGESDYIVNMLEVVRGQNLARALVKHETGSLFSEPRQVERGGWSAIHDYVTGGRLGSNEETR